MKWMSELNDKNNTTTYANCYTNNGQCKKFKICGKVCILHFICKVQNNNVK